MKKEVRLLHGKAVSSLILSVEHFNAVSDRGRVEAVLILLDHAFEMLLKAAILHRGGKIREKRSKQTIGFDACVRRALSDASLQFLTSEQALTLQSINSLRDAAQHHLLDISEGHLYIQAQSGLTLFRDLNKTVFRIDLRDQLPGRALPLSTTPPIDLAMLFDGEVKEIQRLLKPGSRKQIEVNAKLRALAIVEGAFQGEKLQPGDSDLMRIARDIRSGKRWDQVFPGVASLDLSAKGYGPSIDLRVNKKEGIPITLVPEGTPGASVVAIKRVDEQGFYKLSATQLAERLELSPPKLTALIKHTNLKADPECFKNFIFSKTQHPRYSEKAVERLRISLANESIDEIWEKHRPPNRRKLKARSA